MSHRRLILAMTVVVGSLAATTGAQAYRIQPITGITASATTATGMKVLAYSRAVLDVSDGGLLGTPYPAIGTPSALIVRNALNDIVCVAQPLASFTSDPLGLMVQLSSTDPGCGASLTWTVSGPPLPGPPVIGPEGVQVRIETPSTVTGTLLNTTISTVGSTARTVALFVDPT